MAHLSARTLLLSIALALPGCAAPGTEASGGTGGSDSCSGGRCEGISSSSVVGSSVSSGLGQPTCMEAAHPTISLSIDGVAPMPTETTPVDVIFDGVVRASQPYSVYIDACDAGDTGCTPHYATLEVSVATVPVPVGTFVHLRYYAAVSAPATGAIGQHVVVQNVPMRAGVENPVATSERVWLTVDAVDGGAFTPPAGIDPMPITELLSSCGPGLRKLQIKAPDLPPFFGEIGGTTSLYTPGIFEGTALLANLDDHDEADGLHRGYFLLGYF